LARRISVGDEIFPALFRSIPYGQKIETVEKRGVVSGGVALPGGVGHVFLGVAPSRIGWHGGRINWARILAYVTGSVDQELLLRIEYLAAENRILKAKLKGRVRFSDAERARLGEIGHRLGRKVLGEVATVVRPDTILAWYRKLVARKFDGSKARRTPGRPRVDRALEQLIVRMANAGVPLVRRLRDSATGITDSPSPR
jgi:hypothetical protein